MTGYQNGGIIGNNKWKYYISYVEVLLKYVLKYLMNYIILPIIDYFTSPLPVRLTAVTTADF